MPQVKSVRFVSKDEALAIERKKHPELVAGLPGNPLPNAFKVIPRRAEDIDAISTQLGTSKPKGVETICPPAARGALRQTARVAVGRFGVPRDRARPEDPTP
jgi:hypothetical protein